MTDELGSKQAEQWAPTDVDIDRPSAARMYDYLLGGYHNFEIDRKFTDQAVKAFPDTILAAKVNRAFLRRVVQCLVNRGIDQFLDIGSGIPTVGHVHEIAQAINPATRVVYVDIDPVAVSHSRTILKDNELASIVMADMQYPELVLEHEETKKLLDFSKPIAVLFIAVLHFLPDDDHAFAVIEEYRKAVVPGSYVAIAHPSYHNSPPEVKARYLEIAKQTSLKMKHRERHEIEPFFANLELLEPGLVHPPLWQPETDQDLGLDKLGSTLSLAGVGYVR